jgi:cytochrome c biogenesis protein CcmG/thiol:disulfide interchange protein DsbE
VTRPESTSTVVRRTLLVAVVAVVALLGAAVVTLLLRPQTAEQEATQSGGEALQGSVPFAERIPADRRAPLPDRVLDGFAGGPPVDLDSYRGRPLVLNFWATWCAPCVEEMPAFDRVARELGDQVAFLGVDVADPPRLAEPFVEELGIGYDLAVDVRREFAGEVGVATMPTTVFVDTAGTIVYRSYGPLDAPALRGALAEHLGVRAP